MKGVWLIFAAGAVGCAQAPPNLAELIAAHGSVKLAPGQAMGEEVSFACGALTLKGFLYKPAGTGPSSRRPVESRQRKTAGMAA